MKGCIFFFFYYTSATTLKQMTGEYIDCLVEIKLRLWSLYGSYATHINIVAHPRCNSITPWQPKKLLSNGPTTQCTQ